MKIILSLLLLIFYFPVLCQTKISGTLVTTPQASYFILNKFFSKNDSSLLISTLIRDTLLHTSIGGHLLSSTFTLSDSLSIKYNWAKPNEDDYIKDEKLYFICVYIKFESDPKFDKYSAKDINEHLIFINSQKIKIKSRFTSNFYEWDICP